MRNLPYHEPLTDKNGKLNVTGSWAQMFAEIGSFSTDIQENTNQSIYKVVSTLTVGGQTGIPVNPNSIYGGSIAQSTIQGSNIEQATIQGINIANATIKGENIQAATIEGINIASATIVAANIGLGTIIGGNIANGTIESGNIASETIQAGNIQNLTITAAQIANLTITGGPSGKIQTNTISEDNIVAHSLTALSIAASSITGDRIAANTIAAANLIAGTITADSGVIGSIDASKITVNSLRGVNIQSGAFMTNGTYLTTSATSGDTTLYVNNTIDFPDSGNGHFLDTTNDRDTFSYTGKTSTTLTGCTGVLAHNNGATCIPLIKTWVTSNNVNESRFYGDIGNGTIEELASIGINQVASDYYIGVFGSSNSNNSRYGILSKSYNQIAVFANSVSTTAGYGVIATGFCGLKAQTTSSNGNCILFSMTQVGSWTVGSTYYYPPQGLYMINEPNENQVKLVLSGNVVNNTPGVNGLYYFDGTNQALISADAVNHTIHWQRF